MELFVVYDHEDMVGIADSYESVIQYLIDEGYLTDDIEFWNPEKGKTYHPLKRKLNKVKTWSVETFNDFFKNTGFDYRIDVTTLISKQLHKILEKGLTKTRAYDTIQVQTKDRKRQRLTTQLTGYLIGGRLTEEPKPSTWI